MICLPQLLILFLQLCDLIKQVLQRDLLLLLDLSSETLQLCVLFLYSLIQALELSNLNVSMLLKLMEGLAFLQETLSLTLTALFFSLVGVFIHLGFCSCQD